MDPEGNRISRAQQASGEILLRNLRLFNRSKAL
jgi:hypothetical protein